VSTEGAAATQPRQYAALHLTPSPSAVESKGAPQTRLFVRVFGREPRPQGVPAHDARDWNLAHVLGLPIKHVVQRSDSKTPADDSRPYTDSAGTLVGSGL
jgi:leucyl-tRNA synthetase